MTASLNLVVQINWIVRIWNWEKTTTWIHIVSIFWRLATFQECPLGKTVTYRNQMFWNQTLVFTLVSWRYCLCLGRLLWPLWGPADCNNCLHKIFGRGGHRCVCPAPSVMFGPITSGHKGRQRYENAWRALTKSQSEGLEQIYKPIER